MEESILQSKSFDLSVSVYKKVTELQKKQKDFPLSQWWAESVSAVALNMYLAQNIHTKSGLSIYLYTARKAAYRGLFWTKLLLESGEMDVAFAQEIETTLVELVKMLQASINTLNSNRKTGKEVPESGEVS
jgi:four helix bundle protein